MTALGTHWTLLDQGGWNHILGTWEGWTVDTELWIMDLDLLKTLDRTERLFAAAAANGLMRCSII